VVFLQVVKSKEWQKLKNGEKLRHFLEKGECQLTDQVNSASISHTNS